MQENWYMARLGFFAVPWKHREDPNPEGTFFKEYYLIQARDAASALRKAEVILASSENRSGTARLGRSKVHYTAVGVLDLEPLIWELKSGVEVFDESESEVTLGEAKSYLLNRARKRRLFLYDKKYVVGSDPLPSDQGEEFGSL